MANPYAPPLASVRDIVDIHETGTPAERSTRLAATFLDWIIFWVMVYLPLILGSFIAGPTATGDVALDFETPLGIALLVATLVGFVAWLWLTITYMHRNGQSIGKKFLAIKVVRADGSPASLSRLVWLRNVVNGLISIVPLYALLDALFIFGETRQCLHDKIAGTIVVKA